MKVRNLFSNCGKWLLTAFTNLLKFFLWVLLTALAAFLLPVIVLVAIIYYLVTLRSRKLNAGQMLSGGGISFKWIAIGFDHLANIIGGPFFNWFFLLESSPFPFGVPGESLSEILGWNEAIENINRRAKACISFLNLFELDHCHKTWNAALYAAKSKIDKAKAMQDRMIKLERTKAFIEKYS